MAYAKLDIWNMAISHLGEAVEIQSETEKSASARACARFWDVCREKCLRDAPWPFAKKYAVLAASTDVTVPSSEYTNQYVYPSDALQVRRIPNGVDRVDNMQSRIPFAILQAADGSRIIACDVAPKTDTVTPSNSIPQVVYTKNETDTTKFPPDFVFALSYLLAYTIGPRIARDKKRLIDDAGLKYVGYVRAAQINADKEETKDEQPTSEFERARFGGPLNIDKFRLFDIP